MGSALAARPGLCLGAIVLLGTALRVLLLGQKSFWLDEAFSVSLARQPWVEFARVLREREANMGVYYVLLRLWLHLGDGEATVRSLSVVPSVATLPVVYALGRRLYGVSAGLLAALLLALDATHVRYAQEARGYSLAVLLAAAATLLFVRLLERPGRGVWTGYVATAALAVYAHLFGALVLAAQALSLLLLPSGRVPWRRLLAAAAAIALLTAPLGAFLLYGAKDQVAWIPPPDAWTVVQVLWSLAGMGGELLPYLVLGGIGVAAGIGTLRARGRSRAAWRYALPTLWLVLPLALALGLSRLKPILVDRYLLVSLPALVLLAVVGLARLPPGRHGRAPALAGLLALAIGGLVLYYAGFQKEDWRGVTRYVLARRQPADALLFYPAYVRRPFDYYLGRMASPGQSPEIVFPPSDYSRDELESRLLEGLGRSRARVWLISSHVSADDEGGTSLRQVEKALQRQFPYRTLTRFEGVRVVLYERDRESAGGPAPPAGREGTPRKRPPPERPGRPRDDARPCAAPRAGGSSPASSAVEGVQTATGAGPGSRARSRPVENPGARDGGGSPFGPRSCMGSEPRPRQPNGGAMAQETGSHRQPTHTVYTVLDTGGEKSRWLECGVGFTNRDGSLNLLLNALPVNGRLQVRSGNGRGEHEGAEARQGV